MISMSFGELDEVAEIEAPPVTPRLLLVDDEQNILSSLRRSIQTMPPDLFGGRPTIEVFDDPLRALARAGEQAFDLVISDYRMPGMNGVEFLCELIQLQPSIARLILSGYADMQAVVAAVNRTQICRFISKPWDDQALGSAIAQALETRRLQLENKRLADLVRVQQGELSASRVALQRLEQLYPGLTQVKRSDDGAIELDWEDDQASSD